MAFSEDAEEIAIVRESRQSVSTDAGPKARKWFQAGRNVRQTRHQETILDLSKYERELICERIIAGQPRARSQGIMIGRPSKMLSVKLLRDKGMSIREIAKRLEIGVGTVYSILKAA